MGSLKTIEKGPFLRWLFFFLTISGEESVVMLGNELCKARGHQWIIGAWGLFLRVSFFLPEAVIFQGVLANLGADDMPGLGRSLCLLTLTECHIIILMHFSSVTPTVVGTLEQPAFNPPMFILNHYKVISFASGNFGYSNIKKGASINHRTLLGNFIGKILLLHWLHFGSTKNRLPLFLPSDSKPLFLKNIYPPLWRSATTLCEQARTEAEAFLPLKCRTSTPTSPLSSSIVRVSSTESYPCI